jgi:hypothetical protein
MASQQHKASSSGTPQAAQSDLVIRVKRRIDDEDVCDSLCVVNDDEPSKKRRARGGILDAFAGLSTEDPSLKRVYLTRVGTVAHDEGNNDETFLLNANTAQRTALAQSSKKRKSEAAESTAGKTLLVTSGKRTVRVNDQESYVVVDMEQQQLGGGAGASAGIASAATKPKVTSILNPPTRQLEQGIERAMSGGTFDLIVSALESGANVNHRRRDEHGGLTALMAAATHCNLRMAKRLIARGADALVTDTKGMTALDMARTATVPYSQLETKLELQQWLYRAAVRQQQDQTQTEDAETGREATRSFDTRDIKDDEFVYDVYRIVRPSSSIPTSSSACSGPSMSEPGAAQRPDVSADHQTNVPVVHIEGLQINDAGQVDLVFEYDSDWSDLADDEDVDSNDERYEGNDYPEEEDDEDDANMLARKARGAAGEDNDYDMHDELNAYDDGNFAKATHDFTGAGGHGSGGGGAKLGSIYGWMDQQQQRSNTRLHTSKTSRRHSSMMAESDDDEGADAFVRDADADGYSAGMQDDLYADYNEGDDDDDDDDDSDDDDGRLPRFDRRGVGRVLRGGVMDSIGVEGGHGRHDKESLQELWGLDGNGSDEDAGGRAHAHAGGRGGVGHSERLRGMRGRTGMDFASNPREFDRNGLAKYGAELEEDADDLRVLRELLSDNNANAGSRVTFQECGDYCTPKPTGDAVAYDSELDHMSD